MGGERSLLRMSWSEGPHPTKSGMHLHNGHAGARYGMLCFCELSVTGPCFVSFQGKMDK